MKGFNFIDYPQLYNPNLMFVAHIANINSKEELFKKLYNKLMFPDYFGFNWDSLFECFRDFHWITQHGIVLVHDELPEMDEKIFQTYMEILMDAVNDWKEGEEHYFEIVFPKSVESIVSRYLH